MSRRYQHNILANFIGKCWPAVTGLICVPLYVRFLGIEAYGLIGLFMALQTVFNLMDAGLSTTLNRELARLPPQPDKTQEAHDLVRTLELLYWGVALAIALILVLASPWIARHWIHPVQLSQRTVREAVLLMGLTVAIQFPSALYAGGLLGLQRQVLYNVLTVVVVTLRAVGAVVILWWFSPTIQAFLGWQVLMGVLFTLASATLLRRSLPRSGSTPRFSGLLLHRIWRFAAGMSGISVLGVILTQIDKIILSKLLSLEMFGYYSLATVVAFGVYMLASPVYTAAFPRFSQLVAQRDKAGLRHLYHQSCQLVSVAVLPATLVLALFSKEILLLWVGNPATAEHTHLLLSLLITGTALNTLAITPNAVQLAYGWTRLALYQNLVAVLLLIPMLWWLAQRFGAVGAAAVWILLNVGYVVVGMQIMHQRILKGELRRWYVIDIGLPLVGAGVVVAASRWWFLSLASPTLTPLGLLAVSAMTLAGAVIVTPQTRHWITSHTLMKLRKDWTVEGLTP